MPFTFSDRARGIDASGIRRVFDLAADMADPVNLSIGQPHFPTPPAVVEAITGAVREGKTAYSPSQGIRPLLERLQSDVDAKYGHDDRAVFVSSGTSGGLMLALMALVNPGDEVLGFDPYFVMYKHLSTLCGGRFVPVDSYPDFRIDPQKVRDAITPRTRAILCNSPSNPTGTVLTREEVRGLADVAAETGVPLISDEIYEAFTPPGEFHSPAEFNPETVVVGGFSKTWSMTGLRCGWVHGPRAVVEQMIKLQQFTFVCAPHPVQWGGLAALDVDVSEHAADYRRKCEFVRNALSDRFELSGGGGAFYLFPKVPWGTGTEFVAAAVRAGLLVIPGGVFSGRDTHVRVSYAADDATLERGVAILNRLADDGPDAGAAVAGAHRP